MPPPGLRPRARAISRVLGPPMGGLMPELTPGSRPPRAMPPRLEPVACSRAKPLVAACPNRTCARGGFYGVRVLAGYLGLKVASG